MRTLEIVRHSLTRKGADRGGASHLSPEGVRLARVLGDAMVGAGAAGLRAGAAGLGAAGEGSVGGGSVGRGASGMDHVAVGDLPRHLETAIAMGFAVDEQVAWPSGYVEGEVGHHDQWTWEQPFVRYARLLAQGGRLHEVAQEHLGHWRRILDRVPEGGTALIVSSGGSIEPVLVAALPDADHAAWGGPLHHLEGATVVVEGGRFTGVRMRRRVG